MDGSECDGAGARQDLRDEHGARLAQPLWDGQAFRVVPSCYTPEQGLGDTLQFARYAPLVRALAARVLLETQPELRTVLDGALPVSTKY